MRRTMRAALPLFNLALSRSLLTPKVFPRKAPSLLIYYPTQTAFLPFPQVPRARTGASQLSLALSTSSESEEPMTTKHLRLGQIFRKGSSDFIFRITKNVRFYSWTRTEVETLFTDLVDSMDQGDITYELNQFLVLKERREDMIDPAWEVADGQQRLITLGLLYCAIRDCLKHDDKLKGIIQEELMFEEYGQNSQPRITLRRNHNVVLQQLLEGKSRVLKKDTAGQRDEVPQRLVDNYYQLLGMVKADLGENDNFCNRFYCFLRDRVYVYLTIPENQSIARKLVGGARRGQDAEPIDEFKAMCIFRGIQEEEKQENYLENWVKLEEEVSRKLLQEASLLIAQAELGQRCKRDGEVDMLEDYWKVSANRDGAEFFDNTLAPGSRKLQNFRNGFEGRQVAFLRDISGVTIVKPIEIAILSLLIIGDREYSQRSVPVLERVSLLFATTKLTLTERYSRSFELTRAIQEKKPLRDVSNNEVESILHSLDTKEWGSSPQPRKAITAVLSRLEDVITLQESESFIDSSNRSLEHILPQKPSRDSQWNNDWSSMDKESWINRLGNLCILNGKKNSKASNRDFLEKRETYSSTLFPLTTKIAELEQWTPNECENSHKQLVASCKDCFDLVDKDQVADWT